MGRANAAVLPVPVCAVPAKSLPARIIGKARSWIGVGSVNPIAWVPRTTSGESPKLLNDTVTDYLYSNLAQRKRGSSRPLLDAKIMAAKPLEINIARRSGRSTFNRLARSEKNLCSGRYTQSFARESLGPGARRG